jgi:NarL family two-component system response regulator LiaR
MTGNGDNKPLRVVIADDHALVREGIRAVLLNLPRKVEIVGEAGDGRSVLALVDSLNPDVVVMDISMPELNGLEATERLLKEHPQVRVIILSMHQNEAYVWRALRAGACGYLLKKAATSELEAALQQLLRGEVYVSREISDRLLKKFPKDGFTQMRSPSEQLTARQREILQLIAEGRNTKEIADVLKVSVKTVEYHRMKLMERVNIHDIPTLVRYALKEGLVPLEY